jgi:hypothetical protein
MTYFNFSTESQDYYEYHGNVAIEHVRRRAGRVDREWLYFDTAEEAVDFFNDHCAN